MLTTKEASYSYLKIPIFERTKYTEYDLEGIMGEYITAITNNWLMKLPDTNPAIIDMFSVRDTQPYRNYLPWSGEFAGKYLTGAIQILRLTNDNKLRLYLNTFVNKLISLQDPVDGYIGPFIKADRLTGLDSVSNQPTWDVWGHYHIMLGLLMWFEDTGNDKVLKCATMIADMVCEKFLYSGKKIIETSYMYSTEMNHSIIHGLALIYKITGLQKYLDMVYQIIEEYQLYDNDNKQGGDFIRLALSGNEFYQISRARWESLHNLIGIAELYFVTGNEDYRTVIENFWWSIVKYDRHNNGGFSSGEGAVGNPYDPRAIETCCTVAWIALSIEMLRLTGNSIVADELEMSTLNQVIGYQSPDGLFCTYNTPMDGTRVPSMEEIGFQIRPGSEEINCCSANAPRGFGMISDWALMSDKEGIVLNWYGPSTLNSIVKSVPVSITQITEYPKTGHIMLIIEAQDLISFNLKLRIPYWSENTMVKVNGEYITDVTPGKYLVLNRAWNSNDKVEINLDMTLRYWKGENECAEKSSIYHGPLLLAITGEDKELHDIVFDANTLNELAIVKSGGPILSQVIIEVPISNGTIRLQDYGTIGIDRVQYKTWLNVKNTFLVPFTQSNPGRSWRYV